MLRNKHYFFHNKKAYLIYTLRPETICDKWKPFKVTEKPRPVILPVDTKSKLRPTRIKRWHDLMTSDNSLKVDLT